MAWFEAQHLCKEYRLGGGVAVALDDFSLSAERGDFVAIVGRSGSGKTTFLRIVAGLLERTGGEIRYENDMDAKTGMVFQEPRLMPWLTVEKNVLFAFLKERRDRIPYQRARQLLDMLGLGDYRDAYPSQLSGGMAQRVALGRALCYEPELILMDEPLGALDYFTRKSLQQEILRLYFAEKKTIFFVTHDVEEAVAMAGRVAVLDRGKLVGEIPVPLDYPRRHADPHFEEIVERILSLIMG